MTDFLLELRSEEIPARMQLKGKEDLARLFSDALAKAGLAAASVETFATPRRLALIATGLPLATDAVSEETKGPKVGAPPQAMEGFLRKTGLTQDQLTERDGVYFAVVEKAGRQTADVLAEAIPAIIRAFPWPKSQRWGAASISTESLRWVRPLQGIVALLGDDVVPCEIDGIVSGAATMGHRFHHSGPITIGNAGDYIEKLRACHVIVHCSERCRIIRDGAKAVAQAAGLNLVEDEGLVIENAGLTEWPVPMLGRFDPAFLDVPQEVIQLTARVNQKYFVCHDSNGKLANAFVCTANIDAHDGGAAIVAGNEKVLAARLSDAKFFWEQDLKVSLDDQAQKLAQITFHEKLGSVADKVDRVAKLARWLVEEGIVKSSPERGGGARAASDGGGSLPSASPQADGPLHRASTVPLPAGGEELAAQAARAARLCKADLVTGMVGEFPELQGIMGGYYARVQGESDAVADAIRDHYKPVGQGDDVPTAPVTVAVSLADKLDTLAQFFAAGMPPTGSKDPFALRRAAIGFLSLLLQNNLRCSLRETLDATGAGASFDTLEEFLVDRLKVQQREAGVRHDLIDAVFSLGGEDDLVRLLARVKALQAYITTAEGANLLAAYKRAANILKGSTPVSPVLDRATDAPMSDAAEQQMPQTGEEDPFVDVDQGMRAAIAGNHGRTAGIIPEGAAAADIALLGALDIAEPQAQKALEAEQFEDAMAALATLREPIDRFFDEVMVNDEDPAKRAFRLGLLARFRDAVTQVADFSKIEG
ncbi:glycine--tRNA ligase subunit beta [Sphingorhabdus sp.]|uniref:glycine--tRNA ligase subunit beta n=1 Tax=Sphingorhabdus sp. TaxID=1902408 RepID=UPI003983C8AE